ncbi:MAG: dihydroorotase [Desulfobacterota bacterium]|nr:dihydroorotase [Thermodesulfobacteriota bacterium]
MDLLIRNGRVIDPASGIDGRYDLLVLNGKIQAVQPVIKPPAAIDCRIIDAAGCIVTPGLIDMHTHLREPGHEYKETIQSGSRAAAAGGFTSIACMANTEPVNDTAAVTRFICERARTQACVNVFPIGAMTVGLKGETLTEMGDMKAAGIVAVSDDGRTVADTEVMRRCMEYARTFDLPVICHCEDHNLSRYGVMHEGITAMRLGLRGIPPIAEEIIVARDILLAAWTGYPVHIAHVSTAGSVRLISDAKQRGIPVTAETAPHYFTLTEEAVIGFNTDAKVNPPLRTAEDRAAIREGLCDGTIDVIASDHAPHSSLEKDVEFDNAAYGMIGLETSLALTLALVHEGVLTMNQAIEKLTINPARILRLPKGTLVPGTEADITIIDPNQRWTIDRDHFFSKSKNSPLHGMPVTGKVLYTIVAGTVVYPFPA